MKNEATQAGSSTERAPHPSPLRFTEALATPRKQVPEKQEQHDFGGKESQARKRGTSNIRHTPRKAGSTRKDQERPDECQGEDDREDREDVLDPGSGVTVGALVLPPHPLPEASSTTTTTSGRSCQQGSWCVGRIQTGHASCIRRSLTRLTSTTRTMWMSLW